VDAVDGWGERDAETESACEQARERACRPRYAHTLVRTHKACACRTLYVHVVFQLPAQLEMLLSVAVALQPTRNTPAPLQPLLSLSHELAPSLVFSISRPPPNLLPCPPLISLSFPLCPLSVRLQPINDPCPFTETFPRTYYLTYIQRWPGTYRPQNLSLKPYTLHPAPYALHHTLHPISQAPNPPPQLDRAKALALPYLPRLP